MQWSSGRQILVQEKLSRQLEWTDTEEIVAPP